MVNAQDDLSEREATAAGAEAVLVKARPFDELADELFSLIVSRGSGQHAPMAVPAVIATRGASAGGGPSTEGAAVPYSSR